MKPLEHKIVTYCAEHPNATIAEVAAACGVSSNSAYYWIKKLGIPIHRKPGRPVIEDEFSGIDHRSKRYYMRKRREHLCVKGGCTKRARKKPDGTYGIYCKEHS